MCPAPPLPRISFRLSEIEEPPLVPAPTICTLVAVVTAVCMAATISSADFEETPLSGAVVVAAVVDPVVDELFLLPPHPTRSTAIAANEQASTIRIALDCDTFEPGSQAPSVASET